MKPEIALQGFPDTPGLHLLLDSLTHSEDAFNIVPIDDVDVHELEEDGEVKLVDNTEDSL